MGDSKFRTRIRGLSNFPHPVGKCKFGMARVDSQYGTCRCGRFRLSKVANLLGSSRRALCCTITNKDQGELLPSPSR